MHSCSALRAAELCTVARWSGARRVGAALAMSHNEKHSCPRCPFQVPGESTIGQAWRLGPPLESTAPPL
eukprot:5521607-Pyramimonas_sp.AAC.1